MASYVALPAYRVPSGIDFSPLNDALDDIYKDREKNRLLSEAREVGATLAREETSSGSSPYEVPQNRLMSPAQGAAGAAGRDYPGGQGDMDSYKRSISAIESGGRYDLLGPTTRSGDRAYGKYQVMGQNVGPWTREVLGREMSPQEFLSNSDAQEKVFQAKFGQYVQKTGNPQDAASMWFTGRPQAQGANRRDMLGTSGSDYVRKFTAGLGGGGSSAPAQAAPAAAPSSGPNYRAAANTAFRQGNVALGNQLLQQQRQIDETAYDRNRQGRADVRAEESHELTTQAAREELQTKFTGRVASIAQTIASEPDPAKKSAMWQRFVSADPRIGEGLRRSGVDINDPDRGAQMLITEARGLTGKKYEFTKYGVGDPSTGQIKPYPAGAGDADTVLERSKFEQQLRKEYSALTSEKRTINDSVSRVKTGASLDSGTGDLAIVYGYMKLLDPGSVVREGEFATAEQTAGLPQQIVGLYNKIVNGERLTPDQRSQFVTAAEGLASDKEKRFTTTRQQFENIARSAGADPARVLLDEGGTPTPAAAPAAGGNIDPRAVDMLRRDPSPDAAREFDQIFGPGAAQRALGR